MNRKFSILAVVLTVLTLMTSCLKDSTTSTTTYDDAAITNFTLGTLKRIMHTKTKYTKVDSTYQTTVSCSSYAFTIDQDKGLIYNLDSLPVGTCTDKALVTISAANSGVVMLKSFTSDTLYYYSSSSDSLDFSKPRVVKVRASDGSWTRDYTVDVRVHTETVDSLYWDDMNVCQDLAELDSMRALVFGDEIIAYGMKNKVGKAYVTNVKDGSKWREMALPSTAYPTMATDSTMLYLLADGKVYSTTTTTADFECQCEDNDLEMLVTASRSEVYALSKDRKIMVSRDYGETWNVDATDDDYSLLPERDICGVWFESDTNEDIDKVVLMGNRAEVKDSCCVVWSKVVDISDPDETQPWMYQPFYSNQWHNGPALDHFSITEYGEVIAMIGGHGLGTCKETGFDTIYISYDCGQNWERDSRFYMPEAYKTDSSSFAIVADSNNYLWLLCGGTGQVWRGHLSQMVWK